LARPSDSFGRYASDEKQGLKTMTTLDHGSATIYQFPARGRFAANAERSDAKPVLPLGAKLAVGGAWYHDEAIQNDGKQAS
jgi:hypothetical protein